MLRCLFGTFHKNFFQSISVMGSQFRIASQGLQSDLSATRAERNEPPTLVHHQFAIGDR